MGNNSVSAENMINLAKNQFTLILNVTSFLMFFRFLREFPIILQTEIASLGLLVKGHMKICIQPLLPFIFL